jgi:hypothetical protein
MKDFKEYTDTKGRYRKPKRHFENDVIEIRLYCEQEGCHQYIRGVEYYNGGFTAETGQHMDFREQCWICEKHRPLWEEKQKKFDQSMLEWEENQKKSE